MKLKLMALLAFSGSLAFAATVPSGTNLALNITPAVDCSYGSASTADQYFPQGATDGVRCCQDAYTTTWASCHGSAIHFCNVGFSSPQTVGSVALFWKWNGQRDNYMAPQEINVSIYTGGAWVDKVSDYPFQGDTASGLYADSLTVIGWDPAVPADSVKVYLNSGMGYLTYNDILWISEFEIYAATGTGIPPAKISPLSSAAARDFAVSIGNSKNTTRFNISLPQQAEYNLSVYDIAGKLLWNHRSAAAGSTVRQNVWNHGSLSSGIYYAVISQNGQRYSHRFMVTQ